jgi:hypothetical protein
MISLLWIRNNENDVPGDEMGRCYFNRVDLHSKNGYRRHTLRGALAVKESILESAALLMFRFSSNSFLSRNNKQIIG